MRASNPLVPSSSRVHLGADAWTLLAEALPGAPLPYPFRVQDGPAPGSAARAATEQALREAGLLSGDGRGLLEELTPPLRECLLAAAAPSVVVDSTVGIGDVLRVAHHAIRGDVAAGLVRSQRPAGADELELGPVELGAARALDVVDEILRGCGSLEGEPGRPPIPLAHAASRAVALALEDDRPDRARAVIEREAVAPELGGLAAGLRSVALIRVAGAACRQTIVALRVADGWWLVRPRAGAGAVTLIPAGSDDLAAELTAAMALARG